MQKITDNLDSSYTTSFGYDEYNRLPSATAGAYTRSYAYDPWGNLTAVSGSGGEAPNYTLSYATNASGAPATNRINNAGYVYDVAGNPTSAEGWSYNYDAASRLATVNGNGYSVTYGYDGDGRRVKNLVSPNPAGYYLWSSVLGQPVAEIVGGIGLVGRAYVYSPSGQLLAEQSYDGGFYWVHTDHLGSARRLTNTSGSVVYRGEYDPHGQMIYEWAEGGQTFLNSHKFTGYERDVPTQLENANARMYARVRGRFLQPDPMGLGAADMMNPQSLNLYSYVGNDPVNGTDPTGLYLPAPPEDPQEFSWFWDFWFQSLFNSGGGGGGGTGGGDSGGGGEAPQQATPGTPSDLKNSIYGDEKLLKKINDCLKQLLAKNFSKVGEQSLSNAPKIDARLTSAQIASKFNMSGPPYAAGAGHVGGKYGTIFIGKEWFSNSTEWMVNPRGDQPGRTPLQNAYVHELGNLMSYRVSGGTTYGFFGKKGASDEDSGYQLQLCVFGN